MATLKVLPSTSREASSEEMLKSDIYALTTILTSHRYGESQHAKSNEQLVFWRNLSFLLSTTDKEEGVKGANPVVAVTGCLEITPDSYTIVAAVVARKDSRSPPSSGKKAISEGEAPHIEPIVVDNDADKAVKLLNKPEKDVKLQDHVHQQNVTYLCVPGPTAYDLGLSA